MLHATSCALVASAELALGGRCSGQRAVRAADFGLLLLGGVGKDSFAGSAELADRLQLVLQEAERVVQAAMRSSVRASPATNNACGQQLRSKRRSSTLGHCSHTEQDTHAVARWTNHFAAGCIHETPQLHNPTGTVFDVEVARAQPFTITGAVVQWPALTLWQSREYLHRVAGHRLVAVEVGAAHRSGSGSGSNSGDSDHGSDDHGGAGTAQQRLMSLDTYMEHEVYSQNANGAGASSQKRRRATAKQFAAEEAFVAVTPVVPVTEARTRGYLAQQQLFERIRVLRADFSLPKYCHDKDVSTNIWFGAADICTPLHFDRHDNLLSQVVGRKHVLLISPAHTANVYPQQNVDNASSVDIYHPDYSKFPLLAEATVLHCILEPGMILFIPNGWWHAVRSLSVSISLSFWFDVTDV